MTTTETAKHTATLWVCVDCYMAHHGLLETEMGYEPTHAPLGLLEPDSDVTAGLMWAEHECDRASWDDGDECSCEHQTFSWSPCEGCGSHLGGSREALTTWWED